MTKKYKKKLGIGTLCRVPVKFMHPSKWKREKFVNITAQLKISDLIAICQEVKTVAQRQQMCVVFHYDHWSNKEVYCCKLWASVI